MKQEFSLIYYFIITTKGASVNLKGQGHEILDPFLVIRQNWFRIIKMFHFREDTRKQI